MFHRSLVALSSLALILFGQTGTFAQEPAKTPTAPPAVATPSSVNPKALELLNRIRLLLEEKKTDEALKELETLKQLLQSEKTVKPASAPGESGKKFIGTIYFNPDSDEKIHLSALRAVKKEGVDRQINFLISKPFGDPQFSEGFLKEAEYKELLEACRQSVTQRNEWKDIVLEEKEKEAKIKGTSLRLVTKLTKEGSVYHLLETSDSFCLFTPGQFD